METQTITWTWIRAPEFAAYDPQLERKVALKLLRAGVDGGEQARLIREAKAMAKLSHPHVVSVFDAGEFSGGVFVAMEYVKGDTLEGWLRAASRSWRAIVEVFVKAGAGLQAAHDAGLVHRDFKPSNVLVGGAGEVKVLDFGLVRASESADAGAVRELPDLTDMSKTATGALLGTPAYMAPEQWLGARVDPRADVFAFCVALHEALLGRRPFAGETVTELMRAVTEDARAEPGERRGVPPGVLSAINRGLARAPEARWQAMTPLLEVLAAECAGRSTSAGRVAVISGALALGVSGVAFATLGHTDAPSPCARAGEPITRLWNDERRVSLARAFADTELVYAGDVSRRVSARLDDFTRRWSRLRTEACEERHRGAISDEMLDLRGSCLDARLVELSADVELFVHADDAVVERAVAALESIAPLERCADGEYLRAQVRPPEDPQVAAAVESTRGELVRARKRIDAGKAATVTDEVTRLRTRARELEYAPLLAEAEFVAGLREHASGRYADAARTLVDAYHRSLSSSHDEYAARAAGLLVHVHTAVLDVDEARRWSRHASSLASRASVGSELAAFVESTLAGLEMRVGALAAAETRFQRAAALYEETRGHDSVELALLRTTLAGVLIQTGRGAEAARECRASLEILRREVGPTHPDNVFALTNLGSALDQLGRLEEALEVHGDAVELAAQTLGPEHFVYTMLLNNQASAMRHSGAIDDAFATLTRALELREATLGADSPQVAAVLVPLAELQLLRGEHEDARALATRALALREQVTGLERQLLAPPLEVLGRAQLELGRHEEARRSFERGLELVEDVEADERRGALRFGLARARWAGGERDAETLELARQAERELPSDGPESREARAAARAWLAEREAEASREASR